LFGVPEEITFFQRKNLREELGKIIGNFFSPDLKKKIFQTKGKLFDKDNQ